MKRKMRWPPYPAHSEMPQDSLPILFKKVACPSALYLGHLATRWKVFICPDHKTSNAIAGFWISEIAWSFTDSSGHQIYDPVARGLPKGYIRFSGNCAIRTTTITIQYNYLWGKQWYSSFYSRLNNIVQLALYQRLTFILNKKASLNVQWTLNDTLSLANKFDRSVFRLPNFFLFCWRLSRNVTQISDKMELNRKKMISRGQLP